MHNRNDRLARALHGLGKQATGCVGVLVLGLGFSGAMAQEAREAAPATIPAEATVETEAGGFVIRLLPDLAPAHVEHFLATARSGGFDGTTFHRIIPGGIIQGGDPLSKDPANAARYGTGGLGLLVAEFSDRAFERGVVAAVRRPSSVDSAGNQFFICIREQAALKGQYTIFAEVISGMEVVDAISMTPVDGDRAKTRVEMKVTVPEPVAEEK
jgi:peptidyl-prolyl cis-trans isomerase B (cyclophilin B)